MDKTPGFQNTYYSLSGSGLSHLLSVSKTRIAKKEMQPISAEEVVVLTAQWTAQGGAPAAHWAGLRQVGDLVL